MQSTLYLICGMAGAGKTSLGKRIELDTGAVRFSPDEWLLSLMQDVDDRTEMDRLRSPVEQLQWKLAQQLLKEGLDVVLENGFWSRSERLVYFETAKDLGSRVALHFLDVPRSELLRRIEIRNSRIAAGSRRINEDELDTWLGWLERPEQSELEIYDAFEIHTHDDPAAA